MASMIIDLQKMNLDQQDQPIIFEICSTERDVLHISVRLFYAVQSSAKKD